MLTAIINLVMPYLTDTEYLLLESCTHISIWHRHTAVGAIFLHDNIALVRLKSADYHIPMSSDKAAIKISELILEDEARFKLRCEKLTSNMAHLKSWI